MDSTMLDMLLSSLAALMITQFVPMTNGAADQ
jgi:hypothetical protein